MTLTHVITMTHGTDNDTCNTQRPDT